MSGAAQARRSSEPESPLFSVSPQEYGDAFQAHLLEQYKLYVDSANRVSERRSAANNYLLTVNTLLVTLFGLGSALPVGLLWRIIVPLAGIFVSVTWLALIVSYRNLNTAKFAVIHEVEKKLPAALFKHEWEQSEQGKGQVYKPLTHIEQWVPIIFVALYLCLIANSLMGIGPDPASSGVHGPSATVVSPPTAKPPHAPAPSPPR